uniref:Uncharacterized protein n=1 Tax=Oryza glaberrima TaxID=4538 RepID=I1QTU4_ORYGL
MGVIAQSGHPPLATPQPRAHETVLGIQKKGKGEQPGLRTCIHTESSTQKLLLLTFQAVHMLGLASGRICILRR